MPARPLLLALAFGFAACADVPDVTEAATEAADSEASAAPEAPVPAPSAAATDTLTVVFFGDSLTEGYGLAGRQDEAYPALVGAMADSAGVAVRVVNAGVSGHTSADGLARIEWTLRDVTPDVFVLALGANDGLRGLRPEAMEANLRQTLQRVRAKNADARVVIAGMEALPNYGPDYTGRFRAVYPTLAREFDAELIPFLLADVAGVRRLNQGDRLHPTAEGHRVMAATVWRALEPVLREAAERSAA